MARIKIPTIIRKIFPHSFTAVTRIILFLVVFIILCTCRNSRMATQTIEHISVDTIYLNSKQYDRIYIYQDRLINRSRDTLYIHRVPLQALARYSQSHSTRFHHLRSNYYQSEGDNPTFELVRPHLSLLVLLPPWIYPLLDLSQTETLETILNPF